MAYIDKTPTPPPAESRKLLDVPAVTELTGLNPRTVRRMFDERWIPVVKIGRRLFVWSDDLTASLDANTQPARNGGAL